MNILDTWYARALIAAGFTYLAWKYAPGGAIGKTAALAIGSVAVMGQVSAGVPLLGQLASGNVSGLLPAAQQP